MKKKFSADKIVGILVMVAFTILLTTDFINSAKHSVIHFDAAYNASVAANYARYGEYRVSYPAEIVFYNMITTGQTVLLPTALVYRLFGISNLSTCIVPIVYGILTVWAMWLLMVMCLKRFHFGVHTGSAVAVGLLVLSDGLFYFIASRLIGEIAALFFVLVTFISIVRDRSTGKSWNMILAGASMTAAFLTKSSMIFIAVSLLGMLIAETVFTKTINGKALLMFLVGMAVGMMILEPFKLFQLGGVTNYLGWWKNEWQNMLNQSSGVDTTYSIAYKFEFLESIFAGCNRYFCAFLLLLPVFLYAEFFFDGIKRKNTNPPEMPIMPMVGVCGASLIVFFVLLGGAGLAYDRRHEVNAVLVRLFAVYQIVYISLSALECFRHKGFGRNSAMRCVGLVLSFLLLIQAIPLKVVRTNLIDYLDKQAVDEYELQLMDEFLNEIDSLPAHATLFTAGWWQVPNVTLALDREMTDLLQPIVQIPPESYFLSGNYIHGIHIEEIEGIMNAQLVRVDTSEVDYDRFHPVYDRGNVESFAIYKIDPNS